MHGTVSRKRWNLIIIIILLSMRLHTTNVTLVSSVDFDLEWKVEKSHKNELVITTTTPLFLYLSYSKYLKIQIIKNCILFHNNILW